MYQQYTPISNMKPFVFVPQSKTSRWCKTIALFLPLLIYVWFTHEPATLFQQSLYGICSLSLPRLDAICGYMTGMKQLADISPIQPVETTDPRQITIFPDSYLIDNMRVSPQDQVLITNEDVREHTIEYVREQRNLVYVVKPHETVGIIMDEPILGAHYVRSLTDPDRLQLSFLYL